MPPTGSAPLVIATDASVGNLRGIGVAGVAWIAADGRYALSTCRTRVPVVGELTAIRQAITAHPGPRPLTILTDCRPALDALATVVRTGRIPTAAGVPGCRDTARLLRQISVSLRSRPIALEWVKGHADHPLNDAADRLAVQARRCVQTGGSLTAITDLAARIAAEAHRTVWAPLAS
ncbi:RNase H family protein [Geodermatophilus sp. SYSU D01180]